MRAEQQSNALNTAKEQAGKYRNTSGEQTSEAAERKPEEIREKAEAVPEMVRCNQVGMTCHAVEGIILSAAYIAEYLKGDRALWYVAVIMALALLPPLLELIAYSRNPQTMAVKHLLSYGFAVFYVFAMMTTTSTVAFAYVIPMLIAISVFNDYKYAIPINIGVIVVNVLQIALFLSKGVYSLENNLVQVETQLIVMVVVGLYSIYSSKALETNNRIKLRKIRRQSEETERLWHVTMEISRQMAADIASIQAGVGTLSEAVAATRAAMAEVNSGSGDTAQAVQRQLEKTEDIQRRVEAVKDIRRPL